MKLQEAIPLLDIVTDVNGQYSKEERISGYVMLVGVAIYAIRHSNSCLGRLIGLLAVCLLIYLLLIFLLF